MRKIGLLLAGLTGLATSAMASDQPRGTLLELHSCEVYAGSCTVSSEAPMDGRYMLRVWNFTGGRYADADLAGLKVAVLQTSSDNLAADSSKANRAVAYLPQTASKVQRQALSKWLAQTPDLRGAAIQTRTAALELSGDASSYNFQAGKFISVNTAPLSSCETGACGEALWYSPRAATSVFTVALNRASHITEPFLKLRWDDHARRAVFLGKFGNEQPGNGLYVSADELCGGSGKLF